jgi:hypothetical protein
VTRHDMCLIDPAYWDTPIRRSAPIHRRASTRRACRRIPRRGQCRCDIRRRRCSPSYRRRPSSTTALRSATAASSSSAISASKPSAAPGTDSATSYRRPVHQTTAEFPRAVRDQGTRPARPGRRVGEKLEHTVRRNARRPHRSRSASHGRQFRFILRVVSAEAHRRRRPSLTRHGLLRSRVRGRHPPPGWCS